MRVDKFIFFTYSLSKKPLSDLLVISIKCYLFLRVLSFQSSCTRKESSRYNQADLLRRGTIPVKTYFIQPRGMFYKIRL